MLYPHLRVNTSLWSFSTCTEVQRCGKSIHGPTRGYLGPREFNLTDASLLGQSLAAILLPTVNSESRDRLLRHQLCWSVGDLPLHSLLQHCEAYRGSQTSVLCSLPCPLLEGSVGWKDCAWEGPGACCRKRGKEQQLSGRP